MTDIQLISPVGLYQNPVFSHAAVIPPDATVIHVGGQNAVDADGRLVGADDAPAQTRRAIQNVETALGGAGATLSDVFSWTILFVQGIDVQASYAAAAEVLPRSSTPPLVTGAMVAGLAVPGALVEIGAIAAVSRRSSQDTRPPGRGPQR